MRNERTRSIQPTTLLVAALLTLSAAAPAQDRPRIRDLGVRPGILPVGKWNAITDVAGVRLTNTLSVGTAVEAVVAWTLEQPGNEEVRSVNAVVGETNDGRLNDIRARRVSAKEVRAAIASARTGPLAEGSVGAGTGTVALGWKGGIGTSSRVLPAKLGGYTLGALVQSNFGGDGHRLPRREGGGFADRSAEGRFGVDAARRRAVSQAALILAAQSDVS